MLSNTSVSKQVINWCSNKCQFNCC